MPELAEIESVKCIASQIGKNHAVYNGDSCQLIEAIPSESVGFSVFSPPFASLYSYSDSDNDMGNSRNYAEFFEHFHFLNREIYRITMPGRLVSVHCMNLPTTKAHHGHIGVQDFRGDIIRAYQDVGFIYHSEVCIWKDPVTAMQRTKALGLLHKQILKDSCMSRQGIPDYVCTFRKPGANPEPVSGPFTTWIGDDTFASRGAEQWKRDTESYERYLSLETDEQRWEHRDSGGVTEKPIREHSEARGGSKTSIDIWQRYASPVWMDINPSRTLQYTTARDERDERHVCPLQLDVIERCIDLWSNPGDVVFSPFGGIGSEPYSAVKMGRKAIAFELKESYFKVLAQNCRLAESQIATREKSLFGDEE